MGHGDWYSAPETAHHDADDPAEGQGQLSIQRRPQPFDTISDLTQLRAERRARLEHHVLLREREEPGERFREG